MFEVQLTTEERQLVQEILHSSQATLEVEIHRTDRLEFKQALQQRRKVIQQVLAKLSDSLAMAA
jgi:hypothetical protein